MKPARKTIFIEPIIEEFQHGLIVPNAKNLAEAQGVNKGRVIDVGAEIVEDIKKGDTVYYIEGTYERNGKRVNMDEFHFENKTYIAVKEHEIKLVIR